MEEVINIMNAKPGERFRFRMIGKPKFWYRAFLDDGEFLDLESDVDGIPTTKVFASFAIDKYYEKLSVVVMPSNLVV